MLLRMDDHAYDYKHENTLASSAMNVPSNPFQNISLPKPYAASMNTFLPDPFKQVESSSTNSSQYAALLQQIAQLNLDLQKAIAYNQTIQQERDETFKANLQIKDDLIRLRDRYERAQKAIVDVTEQKIESDRRHEKLILEWKKQLEIKARAFENLQRKFAPPKDLEQLRLEIQEELEGPQLHRMQVLRQEVDTQREMAFQYRRELEILRGSYDQFITVQGNEMECVQATHAIQLEDMRKRLQEAEEIQDSAQLGENVRRLEHLRLQAEGELALLKEELEALRRENQQLQQNPQTKELDREKLLANVQAENVILQLDLKAKERRVSKLQEECDQAKKKHAQAEAKLIDHSMENDNIREQIKQKETLVLNSHHSVSNKIRDERAAWERERVILQDQLQLLTQKLQAARVTACNSQPSSQELDDKLQQAKLRNKALQNQLEKCTDTIQNLEKQIIDKEDKILKFQQNAEDIQHNHSSQLSEYRKNAENLQIETERAAKLCAAAQEVSAKIKADCLSYRAKTKQIEEEYKSLQAKHRDTIQHLEECKLEKRQLQSKIDYLERDLSTMNEQLQGEKEARSSAVQAIEYEWKQSENKCAMERSNLKKEMKAALTKALNDCKKSQRKRDAYKSKCLEAHFKCKALMEKCNALDAKMHEMRQEHKAELQHLLDQMAACPN